MLDSGHQLIPTLARYWRQLVKQAVRGGPMPGYEAICPDCGSFIWSSHCYTPGCRVRVCDLCGNVASPAWVALPPNLAVEAYDSLSSPATTNDIEIRKTSTTP